VGNMADRTLLPRIEQWSRVEDPYLRKEVPAALRRYDLKHVGPLIDEWVQRETDPDVKRELFDTLHHMHVDARRPVNEVIRQAALRHLLEQPLVLTRQSLLHLLAPFVGSRREVREAFQAQLKIEMEERSGLYSLVAEYLPAAAIYEALATVPKLQGQFGGGVEPLLPVVPPLGQEVPLPSMNLAMPSGANPPSAIPGGAP
jgi:hypothetical protein